MAVNLGVLDDHEQTTIPLFTHGQKTRHASAAPKVHNTRLFKICPFFVEAHAVLISPVFLFVNSPSSNPRSLSLSLSASQATINGVGTPPPPQHHQRNILSLEQTPTLSAPRIRSLFTTTTNTNKNENVRNLPMEPRQSVKTRAEKVRG